MQRVQDIFLCVVMSFLLLDVSTQLTPKNVAGHKFVNCRFDKVAIPCKHFQLIGGKLFHRKKVQADGCSQVKAQREL
jgi:hypothetical protein